MVAFSLRCLLCVRSGAFALRLGTNVSLREGDLGAGGLELGRHALAALAVPVAECHARALGNETPDRRLADPRCPARHRELDPENETVG